ncbi:MAG TPA: Rpp14/Pop5 family protein [Candidatus Acidoferrum sp.]|nr:Rpp14/Pop5 family protein [Candidatus Acidoferrum sp.]
MKEKHRYILVESGTPVNEREREDFSFGLYNAMLHCVGEAAYHKVNPKVIKFVTEKRFLLKSTLQGSGVLIAALAMMKKVNGRDTYFYTLKTSGTIKAISSFKY